MFALQAAVILTFFLPSTLGFVSPFPSVRNSNNANTRDNELYVSVIDGTAAASSTNNEEGGDSNDDSWKTKRFKNKDVAERTRSDFPILSETVTEKELPLVYLDSAATSQKPKQVLQVLDDYYEKINSNVHRGAHTLSREATAAYEAARDKIAAFINAYSRNEVIFTSGATDAINLVAQTYGRASLNEGDEIVSTVAEHHSNIVPWQLLAQEKGVLVKFVRLDPDTGCLDLAHLESLLTEKTKLVTFNHVSNALGNINPIEEMVAMVRRSNPDAKILVDACQSIPHMSVNVQDLNVDFLVASGHKMCGPTGIGFLWGREDLLNEMPPWKGGGEMIDQVTLDGSTWLPSPSRFEAGTPPIAQAIGVGAAIDYLQSIGMDKIEAYEHEMAEYLYSRLQSVPGITILGSRDVSQRAALCTFCHDTVHPSDLSSFLDVDGVAIRAGHHCCQPLHTELGYSHSARASLYFYNTKE